LLCKLAAARQGKLAAARQGSQQALAKERNFQLARRQQIGAPTTTHNKAPQMPSMSKPL
jgi:hypothetical protein